MKPIYLWIFWTLLVSGTIALSQSLEEQFQSADAELNRVYKELRSQLNEEQKAELKKSQLAWIKEKDRLAKKTSSSDQHQQFLTQVTIERTLALRNAFALDAPSSAPQNVQSKTATKSKLTTSTIQGSTSGARWAYEFVEYQDSPTVSLATDSSGLLAYADDQYVVRVSSLKGESLQGSVVSDKTELSFYDAQTLKLNVVLSVPNNVFCVGRFPGSKEDRFYVATVGTVHVELDVPAIVLVSLSTKQIERIPLLGDFLQTRYDLKMIGRTINVESHAREILKPNGRQIQPKEPPFKDIEVSFSFAPVSEDIPPYSYANSHTFDEENWKLHRSLASQDPAALAYVGAANLRPTASEYSRGQFAIQWVENRFGGLWIAKAANDGRISILDLGELSSEKWSVDPSGANAPHIFDNGVSAALGGGSLHLFKAGTSHKVELPSEANRLLMERSNNSKYLKSPSELMKQFQSANPEFAKLMFSGNRVGVIANKAMYELDVTNNNSFIEIDVNENFKKILTHSGVLTADSAGVMFDPQHSGIERRGDTIIEHTPTVIDWDKVSSTYVIRSKNAMGWTEVFRVDTASGRRLKGDEYNIQTEYDTIVYSAPSGNWRSRSFVSSSSSDGLTWGVKLETIDGKKDIVVVRGLGAVPDPLAVKISGGEAFVLYGANGKISLVKCILPSGVDHGELQEVRPIKEWAFANRFGNALVESKSGTLFVPNASGFEVWNIWQEKANKRFDLVLGEGDQYAVLLPKGSYAGSPGCESLLRLKAGGAESVDGSSVAQWRNRPAEVLKALNGDPAQIEILSKVTERWLKKLGNPERNLEPTAADIPSLNLANDVPLWAKGESVVLKFTAKPGTAPVKEVIVRVNGVDQQRGSNTVDGQSEVNRSITLAEGQNWIEAVAIDEKGRSSNLVRFRTILSEAAKPTKRYVIAIGVSNYRDSALNLEFAAKDATDLASAIKESAKGETEVLLLTNEQATKDATTKIREFLANATENDEVVAFCAGHGVLDSNLDYVYSSHEFDSANPSETGIKLDELVDAIGSSKSLKRLLLLDTCHSGQVGEKDEMLLAQMKTELPKGVRAVKQRGMSVKPVAGLSAEGQQRFIEEMFLLPGIHRGINIIGASGGAEFALESAQWNNGVFTASIIEALREKKADLNEDGRVSVGELRNYLAQRVSELTKGAQKPSVVAAERDQDFDLIRVANKTP